MSPALANVLNPADTGLGAEVFGEVCAVQEKGCLGIPAALQLEREEMPSVVLPWTSGHRQDIPLHCALQNWKFPEKFPSKLSATQGKTEQKPGSGLWGEKNQSGTVPFPRGSQEFERYNNVSLSRAACPPRCSSL